MYLQLNEVPTEDSNTNRLAILNHLAKFTSNFDQTGCMEA